MFFHLSPYFYFLFSKFSVLYFPPLNLTFFHFKHPSVFASPLFSALHLFRAVLPKDKYLDVLGCWESFYSDWVLFPKVFIILPLLSAFISSKKQPPQKKNTLPAHSHRDVYDLKLNFLLAISFRAYGTQCLGVLLNHLKQTVPVSLRAIHWGLAQKDTNYHFSWLKKHFWFWIRFGACLNLRLIIH